MGASDLDRIKSKLFALNMRLAEVNSEVAAVQARVFLLEKQLEDARLAALMGEDFASPEEIRPQLELSRGTLEDRLTDVRIRAKTGTLDDVSALSGWVWVEKSGGWVEFSILSSGFNEWTAKRIEDRIVRIVSFQASAPP